jgi:hypothetical protein
MFSLIFALEAFSIYYTSHYFPTIYFMFSLIFALEAFSIYYTSHYFSTIYFMDFYIDGLVYGAYHVG